MSLVGKVLSWKEELNIHPAFICLKPNSKPITKTKRETINKNKVKNVEISFGKNLSNKSIDTNPPHLYAEGAINPVIHENAPQQITSLSKINLCASDLTTDF